MNVAVWKACPNPFIVLCVFPLLRYSALSLRPYQLTWEGNRVLQRNMALKIVRTVPTIRDEYDAVILLLVAVRFKILVDR